MNKRLEKLMVKLSEKRVVTPRRDQVKKMVSEKAFDTMIYRGYDEVYNVEPVEKTEFTTEDIANHWWTGADMWATMEQKDGKEWIEITLKFGYTYIELRKYINVVEEVPTTEAKNITVSSEEITVELNEEKNGIEVKFNNKPSNEIIEELKSNGFRWSKYNKCWYAKQSENTIKFAYSLIMEDVKEDELFADTPGDEELLNVEIIEESEEVETIELNKNTVEFVNVDSLNINIQARMPKLNKNDSLQDNDESINKYGFDLEPCKVKRIIFLTNKQYDYFSNNLLNDYDFLDKGGHNSLTNYVNVIVSTGRKILIVNPEGYKYCRYTGYIQNDYHNSLHNAIEELDPFTDSEYSKQLTKALEEFYYMLTGETPPDPEAEEEPQQENTNVISLDSFRSKKAAKEIKQPKKNNKIIMCVCGSIIHDEDYKNIGICPNCINHIMEKFYNGTLKTENLELYNMIDEGLKN